MDFTFQKELRLQKSDLSRKGSIDAKIVELVNFINKEDCYVTTSSCSGRISVFTNSELKKKGCNWMFITHDVTTPQLVIDALHNHTGSAILKFEPFIMHIQCMSLEAAQALHALSIESGFRNSGMTISKKGNIIVAIRCTLALEVPLSSDGVLLVSHEYISFVVNLCNEKLTENWKRIERLYLGLQKSIAQSTTQPDKKKTPKVLRPVNNNNLSSEKTSQIVDRLSPDLFCDGFDNLLK
ncbi:hypothetical protein JTE90_007896 [Oedothorax gibbosus]|uniref:tRNA wybutosine-synthesizing protein 3 homolog n=1 Tax=Oedothorax gibbosus TaxID=931172 RepID=A0AAV6VKS8_9ARAC|nr:hypothetical protein JTE90_007896 [Oedothorax gibbosus]